MCACPEMQLRINVIMVFDSNLDLLLLLLNVVLLEGIDERCASSPLELPAERNCSTNAPPRYVWSTAQFEDGSGKCIADLKDCDSANEVNSFASEAECMMTCAPPPVDAAVCLLELSNLCSELPHPPRPHYYFDAAEQQCMEFSFFGCPNSNNGNNFATRAACESTCSPLPTSNRPSTDGSSQAVSLPGIELTSSSTELVASNDEITAAAAGGGTSQPPSTTDDKSTIDSEHRSSLNKYIVISIVIGSTTFLLSTLTVTFVILRKIISRYLLQTKIMQRQEPVVVCSFSTTCSTSPSPVPQNTSYLHVIAPGNHNTSHLPSQHEIPGTHNTSHLPQTPFTV